MPSMRKFIFINYVLLYNSTEAIYCCYCLTEYKTLFDSHRSTSLPKIVFIDFTILIKLQLCKNEWEIKTMQFFLLESALIFEVSFL